jgi:hypothetical protein
MKTSILAVFCLVAVVRNVQVLAAGDGAGAHARHSRTQSSGSFNGELKTMFKTLGHVFKHGAHAVRGVARHTGRPGEGRRPRRQAAALNGRARDQVGANAGCVAATCNICSAVIV